MRTRILSIILIGLTSLNARAGINCFNYSEVDGSNYIHVPTAVWLNETNDPDVLSLHENLNPRLKLVPTCHNVEDCPTPKPDPNIVQHGFVQEVDAPFSSMLRFANVPGSKPMSLTIDKARIVAKNGNEIYYASDLAFPKKFLQLACKL